MELELEIGGIIGTNTAIADIFTRSKALIYGYIIIGRCTAGRFKDENVIVGNFKINNLFPTKLGADIRCAEVIEYLRSLQKPEIDPDTIRVLPVQTLEIGVYNS